MHETPPSLPSQDASRPGYAPPSPRRGRVSATRLNTGVRAGDGAARPSWLRRLLLSEYLVLLLTGLYVLVMVPLVPEIVAADTWRDIMGAMVPLLIVATGQAFVLIVAGIDLSATSNLAISSVLAAAVMTLEIGRAHV